MEHNNHLSWTWNSKSGPWKISYVFNGCDVIQYDVKLILIVARRLLLWKSVKGFEKNIVSSSWWTLAIFVPPEMSTKREVWWPYIFFNSWIWFTCISLMVHIRDKKKRFMSYLFRYFHDALIPIMTAVTFEDNLTKNVLQLWLASIDILVFSKYSQKYTKYKNLRVAFTSSFNWP